MQAKYETETLSSLLSNSLQTSAGMASNQALVLVNHCHINAGDDQRTDSDDSDADTTSKRGDSTDEDSSKETLPRTIFSDIVVDGKDFMVHSCTGNYFGDAASAPKRDPESMKMSQLPKTYSNIKVTNGGSFLENSNSNNTNAVVSAAGVFPPWMMGGGMPSMGTPGMFNMGPMGPMGPMGSSYGSRPKKQGRSRKHRGL